MADKTVFEHIRDVQQRRDFPNEIARPDPAELRKTQWNSEFENLMRNRMVFGAFRYGTLEENAGRRWDFLASINRRLDAYFETGNTENLVDVANYCLVEFTNPQHPDHHFRSVDDGVHSKYEE